MRLIVRPDGIIYLATRFTTHILQIILEIMHIASRYHLVLFRMYIFKMLKIYFSVNRLLIALRGPLSFIYP